MMFLSILTAAGLAGAAASDKYQAQTDSTAYEVVLWKNGNSKQNALVSGFYKDLDKENTGHHQECTVRISKEEKGERIEWRISVSPKDDWGVAEVRYPMLFLPKLTNDFLVTGTRTGERIPLKELEKKGQNLPWPAFRQECQGVPEFFNKKGIYWSRYPGLSLNLQMIMYENDEQGCMIWTPDNEAWVKDFVLSLDLDEAHKGQGYRAYIAHFPENTGQKGTVFNSPYPVVTTSYSNGWYAAARVYRKWAVKQWWCSKGKIYDRPSTPAWFKAMHLWGTVTAYNWIPDQKPIELLAGRTMGTHQMSQWAKYYNCGEIASPDYLPPNDAKRFRSILVDYFKERNIHQAHYLVFLYICADNGEIYSRYQRSLIKNSDGSNPATFTEFPPKVYLSHTNNLPRDIIRLAERMADFQNRLRKAWNGPLDEALLVELAGFSMDDSLRKAQEKVIRDNWGKDTNVIDRISFCKKDQMVCLADPFYQDACLEVADKMFKDYRAEMVYFDCFPNTALPCYNKTHGHPLGYGRFIAQGNRDLCRRIIEKNPAAILACESGSAEYLMDVMHITYHKGMSRTFAIPLFASIYQGYLEYSNWWIWPPFHKDEDFTSCFARSLHYGYLPGGAVGGGILSELIRQGCGTEDAKMKFLLAGVDIRRQYRDFIAAGVRLQPPAFEGPPPQELQWYPKGSSAPEKIKISPIQVSKWARNHEANKGLILISNHSANPYTVTIEGRKIDMAPFSWKGIEVEIDAGRQPAVAGGLREFILKIFKK